MSESYRKLTLFSIIFASCAIAVYFYSNGNESSIITSPVTTNINSNVTTEMQGELISIKASLESDPNNIQLFIRIANLYYDLNQPDSAITYYEKALLVEHDKPDILTDCAVMYFRSGDNEKALNYLDKAITIQPDFAQAWFNKGFILMAGLNQPAEGVKAWKIFIEFSPESEQAQFIKKQIKAIESGESK